MAITSSAKKAIRGAAQKRVFNLRRTRAMIEAIKKVRKLAIAKQLKEAQAALPAAYQAIDKAAKRGVIKAGNAARKKSGLARLLAAQTNN
jgi:small subunit ribosomal protein S20